MSSRRPEWNASPPAPRDEDADRGCGRCAPAVIRFPGMPDAPDLTIPGPLEPSPKPASWSGVARTWGACVAALLVFLVALAVGAGIVAAIVASQVAWAAAAVVEGIRDANGPRGLP